MAAFAYCVTPYDPADPPAASGPGGTRIPYDSRERVVGALTAALAGFALDAGADYLTIDNPMTDGFFSFSSSVRHGGGGYGLCGLFPYDRSGYHDGARIPLATGLGLLRAMVLRQGAWCRLRGDHDFFLHVGEEDDIYVGSSRPLEEAAARARTLGLFSRQVEHSPYDPAFDETWGEGPADEAFWTDLNALVADLGTVLMEERPVANSYRWHRLASAADVQGVREWLTPRARLAVWPDLTEDAETVRTALARQDRLELLVQQFPDGSFRPERIAEPALATADVPNPAVPAEPGHRAALVPLEPADRDPLLAAVLPDPDGVLRARWRTNRTRADERRTFLASLAIGDAISGVVATGLNDVGVYVHLGDGPGHGLGFLRVPEMSWARFDSVDDIAPIGREIRAQIIHIDWLREQVSLSLKELLPNPWQAYVDSHETGQTVAGTVTRLLPFGAFVRVADGIEGLVPLTELADHEVRSPEDAVAVGDEVYVALLGADPERRRINLSLSPSRPR
ncbi:S1 RNA-binding domain-containing protein [Streptomyces sp. NPDC059989]|uniref:S1 RNA-binding domain-containing protein n=1 Tax=Streptomyces sp. NPDC059989 TaxID=3347026 RepID=UPI00368EDC1C